MSDMGVQPAAEAATGTGLTQMAARDEHVCGAVEDL